MSKYCTCVWVKVSVYMCAYICMYICMYMCMYVYVYICLSIMRYVFNRESVGWVWSGRDGTGCSQGTGSGEMAQGAVKA